MLVEVDQEGHVATLTLNRPELRNALSIALCDAITDAMQEIDRTDARAVMLRGSGTVFCSGADFAAVSGPGAIDFLPAFERMLETVADHRLPTVAAIHGGALGGGLQLATVCDFRIAAADAKLGIPSSRLGIVVNYENVRRLVLLAGVARAKEILMTARTFTGAEASAAGLVTESVPPEDLGPAAAAFAARIAGLAPLAVQGSKRAIAVITSDLGDVRARDSAAVEELDRLVLEAYRSADLQEGLRAMGEKRPPEFEGR